MKNIKLSLMNGQHVKMTLIPIAVCCALLSSVAWGAGGHCGPDATCTITNCSAYMPTGVYPDPLNWQPLAKPITIKVTVIDQNGNHTTTSILPGKQWGMLRSKFSNYVIKYQSDGEMKRACFNQTGQCFDDEGQAQSVWVTSTAQNLINVDASWSILSPAPDSPGVHCWSLNQWPWAPPSRE